MSEQAPDSWRIKQNHEPKLLNFDELPALQGAAEAGLMTPFQDADKLEDIIATALSAMAELEQSKTHVATLRESLKALVCDQCTLEISKLKTTLFRERQQAQETNRRRNLELDALHYVWCDGGCEKGVHRFGEHPPLTAEIVEEAKRNTERLERRFKSQQARAEKEGGQ